MTGDDVSGRALVVALGATIAVGALLVVGAYWLLRAVLAVAP